MDWKEDTLKAAVVAILGVIGHAFLKFFKKSVLPLVKTYKDIGKFDKIVTDTHYSLELVKAIMHISPQPMYLMDLHGNMEYVNAAWCEKTEFRDPDDATGYGWLRAIPDKELDNMRRKNDDFVKSPSNVEGTQIMMGIYSNKEFTVHFKTVLLDDENKKPFKVLGILEIINQ